MDAAGGFAPLALELARTSLIERAQTAGVAAMAVINVHHFSALWADVEPIAERGCVALACTAYLPAVAPAGSQKPFFGTNPMAFAWPRNGKPPLVIDQSSAAMARGEVMIAARDGKPLPPGVGLDEDGNPTTEASEVLKGVMLPFGGHKGSSIALMIELLAAGLIGEAFSIEAKQRDNGDGGPPILPLFAVLALWASSVAAHNVTEGDAGYIQEIWGVNIIPFMYLGAKHMVTGYDHILFLLGVVFFLYKMKDVGIYVSIFALGHSTTMLAGVWFGWGVNAYGRS